MPNPITLPILAALDYLHAHNLTIDRLWTEKPDDAPLQTHITTKPRAANDPEATEPAPNKPQRPPTCTICRGPKDDPAHATCLSVACLEVFFGKKG